MSKKLYSSISGVTNISSIDISTNHSSSFATAVIHAESTTKGVGDSISIDLGYESAHGTVFTGYVKETVKDVPDNTLAFGVPIKIIGKIEK